MAARAELAPVGLIGESPAIQEIKRIIRKVGPTNAPVLILGETGTGKELIANALYATNPAGRFVVVNCGTVIGPLMETELFGHVKGAFSGAVQTKVGLLEIANGGTAFFDEIGELPLDTQVKLLRVLQEKEIRPVGSNFTKQVDFRVIAATHRDLRREVREGRFREDLYYRLNVVKLQVPSLRERKEDLRLLIDYYLRRFGHNLQLTDETMQSLLEYPWPGNVRELQHCLHRMSVMNSGPYLHPGDLPTTVRNDGFRRQNGDFLQPVETGESVQAFPSEIQPAGKTGFLTLDEREQIAIREALALTKNDKVMAANLLGISRTTLYRKLKRYEEN